MSELQKAMAEVNDLNRTHGVTQRGGKKYTEVFVRVEAFRKAFGTDHGINTEILTDDGKRVVVKASITNSAGMVVGSGMAEEIRGQGNVNKTSALENAETSAIGRALASIGLHGGTYASLNEIDAVPRKAAAQSQQAQSTQPPPAPPAGDLLTLKNHIGQEKGSGDAQEFTANLIKLIAAYTKLEATKEGTVIPPRERMTLLREADRAEPTVNRHAFRWVQRRDRQAIQELPQGIGRTVRKRMMETWKQMKARQKRELIGVVEDLAGEVTQVKAAEKLEMSQALLSAFCRKHRITWETDGRKKK